MDGKGPGSSPLDTLKELPDKVQGSQAWNSIFRPGSIFRQGYSDSPRNRSYVIMNSVLYHPHPVKVKRHAVKVSYTLCLGGLSFFLFILLTITGIFLMFFYRPTAAQAWSDIYTLQTSVTFGLLVRNMHRWAAHLMVLSVFLHMARVFYHGAYKPPREFNWVIGVVLLLLTLLLSFTGYLLPWDQLALWAVTVGKNMMGYTPVFGNQVRFVLLGGSEIGTDTLLRWYVLHVLLLPFVIVIFMARSEEHTSELQSRGLISYGAFFFLSIRRPPRSTLFPYATLFPSEIGADTLLRWYVLHVLLLPFVIVIFMA